MTQLVTIGIVGATGVVGQTAVDVLTNDFSHFRVKDLKVFASKASVGKRIPFGQKDLVISELNLENLSQCDVLFFASDAAIAKEFIPQLAAKGILCVDKSSAYRDDAMVPLVVPEVNGHAITKKRMSDFPVIANPNCCATPLVVALKPFMQFGLKRVVVSTYQSVSGAGKAAVDVLRAETQEFFRSEDLSVKSSPIFPKTIAFNVMPYVSSILENLDTDEESKIIAETRKMLELPHLKIAATSVRVPTFVGHAESVSVELTEHSVSLAQITAALQKQAGVKLIDAFAAGQEDDITQFATPREVHGTDEVYVSRLRPTSVFDGPGFSFWLACDNLRKGAALNAIQILDYCAAEGILGGLRK